ncbi:lipopolysaccharide export system protein LptA [Sphingomonas sp. BE123]|uniref:LptA/OstA family protein n=1 Tax=unclassified Sphingomonas TaxID=196159 RepID=UPI0028655CE6|nr:LptA/OstA family protein [Sphingomonas sp. BE123]MDR6851905.1 lipopolysaccharide export system protein LptA [Sphingomonas sp. BE123]
MARAPRPLLIAATSALVTTALLGGAALGQSRHDSSAPIEFDAQSIELQDRANRAILSGGVKITQANMTLTATRVTVSYTGQVIDGSPSVSRFDASGGVTIARPDQTARAQYGVYDINRRVITMLGDVTLTQGGNTVTGGRLTIDLDSGRAAIDGSGVGTTRAPDGSVVRSGGRVTGRFTVPDRD